MKGRGMNILKPIIICLVLVALEPIRYMPKRILPRDRLAAQVRPLQATMVYGAHTDAGTRGQATKTHEKMILVSKGYDTSLIGL